MNKLLGGNELLDRGYQSDQTIASILCSQVSEMLIKHLQARHSLLTWLHYDLTLSWWKC